MMSKQVWLGLALVLGGGVVLAAVATKPKPEQPDVKFDEIIVSQKVAQPETQVLTADIETEKKIVAEKQKKREYDVALMEQRAKELLAAQEQAKAQANSRAEAEAKAYQPLSVQTRPESEILAHKQAEEVRKARQAKELAAKRAAEVAKTEEIKAKAEKKSEDKPLDNKKATTKPEQAKTEPKNQKGRHVVQSGDNLVRLARRYGVSVEAIAQANQMGRDDNLPLGKSLKIPSASEVRRLESKKATTKPEQAKTEPKNQKGRHVVQSGDNLVRLARRYGVSVEAIAQANQMGRDDNLPLGKSLKIPSASEVHQLEKVAAKKAQEKAKKAEASQRLTKARQEAKKQGSNEKYAVQVLLAANQENADKVVKQLKAAGYKATTSQTSRGVRVMVGPERSREAAVALKDKIKHDGSVNANGAWVTKLKE